MKEIHNAARPKTKRELKSFLVSTRNQQQVVPKYAAIAKPLLDRVKESHPERIIWDESCEKAFCSLKVIPGRDNIGADHLNGSTSQ